MAHEEIEQLAKTAERERIARDMHDVLGHSLSLIVLKSELAGRLLASQPARAALEIAEIETAARQALAEVRKTITGYRSEGFASELTRAAQVLETAGVRLNKPAKAPYLTPRHEATLSLVLREAVTNIVRHAGASECSIEVSTEQDRTQLVIADDGRGDIRQEGNGLRGMRERVQELGGSLSLESSRGTRLHIELPQFRESLSFPQRSGAVSKQIRVVLAEDQAMVLGALAALLEIEKDIAVVARARNGREAMTLVAEHKPDVLITDIEMPEMSGLTLAAEVHSRYPRVHIVILTTFARAGYLRRAMDAGAQGYMLKDRPAAELADCVRRVCRGLRVVDPELAAEAWTQEPDPLSERERQILWRAGEGKSGAEIAVDLALVRGHGAELFVRGD